MKAIVLCIGLLAGLAAHSQFYYRDVIGANEMADRQQLYTKQKVHTVTVVGYDPNGRVSADFGEKREVKENGSALQITTRNESGTAVVYFRFNNKNQLVAISDTASGSGSKTLYQYDEQGRLKLVQNFTTNPIDGFDQEETHSWYYGSDGKPEKMFRIVNKRDSTEYRFGRDESGNVADEQVYRYNQKSGDPIYYYYNEDNLLSDIVRFDKYSGQLMPELVFLYDASKRLLQKMVITSNINRDYLNWRYFFNENGLPSKEVLFNKQKEITGRFEYSYTFRP